jgi:hypothetical protein
VYDLGQGVKTTNPEKAGELLMKREYPDILNCESKPHPVQFLPDCYLYGELAWKVNNNSCSILWCIVIFNKHLPYIFAYKLILA